MLRPHPWSLPSPLPLLTLSLCLLCLSARAQIPSFADDFESGTLLVTDNPAGKWESFATNPNVVLSANSAAAHRGSFGFRVADARNLSGVGVEGNLYRTYANTPGNLYVRFWLRYTSTQVGKVIHSQLMGNAGNSLFDLASDLTTGQLDAEGFVAGGGFSQDTALTGFSPNTWYLVEQAVLAVGTSSGQRKLWINGQLRSTGSGIDYSGLTLAGENLGEPYSDDGVFGETWTTTTTGRTRSPTPAIWD